MMDIYLSDGTNITKLEEIIEGCWVNLVSPTEKEIQYVISELNLEDDYIYSALDEEERSRIEINKETGDVLIIADTPIAENESDASKGYSTNPLGIIFTNTCVITVCTKENIILKSFITNKIKTFFTFKKSRFILQILYKNASLYLHYLKQIDKRSVILKEEIHKSMRNKELLELLDLENSLVYFNTSLRSNELVMEKLMRYDFIKKYDEDRELLEDIIIENKQAMEMSKIYSDILGKTMDAFASIISNNLNNLMKFLTSVTIIMSIPNIVSGFLGMNVAFPFSSENPTIVYYSVMITVAVSLVLTYIMYKRKMF